jgi:hypothetical protein
MTYCSREMNLYKRTYLSVKETHYRSLFSDAITDASADSLGQSSEYSHLVVTNTPSLKNLSERPKSWLQVMCVHTQRR